MNALSGLGEFLAFIWSNLMCRFRGHRWVQWGHPYCDRCGKMME